jgi:hypothetical protein
MSYLLWFVMFLLAIIPAVTCFVYYHQRLGTRRDLLKETLISLQLEDAYMCMRHGEIPESERKEKFDKSFENDFRAGLSPNDYFWPVTLVTVIGLVGWFLTFSRVYPSFTGFFDASSFLPDYFAYGFAGAFFAGVLTVFDEFRMFNLDPNVYYSATYRMLFSSTAAYLAAQVFKDTFSPLVAFGIGLFPIQTTWKFITDKTAQAMGTASKEGELGAALANIQGLEDQRSRKKLLDVDISTVQALATADPLWLFLQTTFPLRTIIDMIDKAILYLYLGDTVTKLRTHGINGVIELIALVPLANRQVAYGKIDSKSNADTFFDGCDPNKLVENLRGVLGLESDELKAFIYNLYYDPLVRLLYDTWGRYLNPQAIEAPTTTSTVTTAGGAQPTVAIVQPQAAGASAQPVGPA